MLIVIFFIGLTLLTLGIFIFVKFGVQLYLNGRAWVYWMLNGIGVMLLSMSCIVALGIGVNYSSSMIIDEKIEIYKNENSKIEQQISIIINDYMEHETETFEKIKNKDSIALISAFPELKTNELVAKQIEIYIANNKIIKDLECEKLKYKIYAWWLFFGS